MKIAEINETAMFQFSVSMRSIPFPGKVLNGPGIENEEVGRSRERMG